MSGVVDDRGRVVVPKHVLEELGLSKGDMITFERAERGVIIRKGKSPTKRLEAVMSWNPKRTGTSEAVSPKEMKEIWKS